MDLRFLSFHPLPPKFDPDILKKVAERIEERRMFALAACPCLGVDYYKSTVRKWYIETELIGLGHLQRASPNTHCSGNDKSKGFQWVLSDATL